MTKKILGISAYYHDSAAAILINGQLIAAAHEERFSRIKHDAAFPAHAIRYCLQETGLSLSDLDAVVFYDKPFLKFERLLQSYYQYAPKGWRSFLKAMPVWIKEKLLLKQQLLNGLKEVESFDRKQLRLLFTEHHVSHAASAFFASAFTEAAILTIDGVGEWSTSTIAMGKGNSLEVIREMIFPHSVGLLYSAFTHYLGFTVNSGEYKLMGLAPYGNADAPDTAHFKQQILAHMVDVKPDGSIWMNQDYFNYAAGLSMTQDKRWEQLLGLARRHPEATLTQQHCDLALAIQQITEDIVLKMAAEAKRITGAENLCMAGGVALNCVANGRLLASGLFKQIFIQPAAGDAGGAPGAAWAAHHLYFNQPRNTFNSADFMHGAYLGPDYSSKQLAAFNQKTGAVATRFTNQEELLQTVAQHLSNGAVIGWFQGRMEFGPRALGHRSILANPAAPDMQQTLNKKIKFRETFRPFAPVICAEQASRYFHLQDASPYMLFVAKVKDEYCYPLPPHFASLPLKEKLAVPKSPWPAITHLDYSARVQTVHHNTNPRLHRLLQLFEQQSGIPMLVNTSFNVRGEPMVCTPADAYRCFMHTGMDYLVMGDFLYHKQEQPAQAAGNNYIRSLKPD